MNLYDPISQPSSVVVNANHDLPRGSTQRPARSRVEGMPLFWIAGDIRAKAEWLYGSMGVRQALKALVTDGTFAMVLYRCMQQASRLRIVPVAMILNKLNTLLGGCVIGRCADFGPAFVLIHSNGVVINSSVRGGSHVYIEHQVTVGAERGAAPMLGDGVFIGAGAKVIGAVRIGDHVKIGANAVVVKDAPSGATVVGVPAQVVRIEGRSPGDDTVSRND